jgi:hypothetical protein
MLAGNPAAAYVCFTISNDYSFLPSDLDGSTPPPDGTPGYFTTFETFSTLRMYKLAPNFAVSPPTGTLTLVTPDISVFFGGLRRRNLHSASGDDSGACFVGGPTDVPDAVS